MMLNSPKISVIVPIYNAERYLHKCIQSILMQSYVNFELILIDDGSIDRSGMICDEFAKQDTRIRVFHESNKGVSSARNFGIEVSLGQWITFIDSDDWVEVDYLNRLIVDNEDYDLVMGYYYAIGWDEWHSEPWEDRYYIKENIKSCLTDNLREFSFICSKIYKNTIIKEFGIRFDPKISYAEDSIFTLNYLLHINSIRILPDALYCYNCFSTNSLTTKSWAWESAAYAIEQMCNVLSSIEYLYDWEGRATKNYYTWAFLRKYLNGVVKSTSIFQMKSILRKVCQNSCVFEIFKPSTTIKSYMRRLFDFFMFRNFYLIAAIMLRLESYMIKK